MSDNFYRSMVLAVADLTGKSNLTPVGYGWALAKMLVALLVVCLLAYFLLRFLRYYFSKDVHQRGNLKVVDRCFLSPRHSVWIVEASGRYFLLGSNDGPGGPITKLAELEESGLKLATTPDLSGKSFWDVFSQRRGKTK